MHVPCGAASQHCDSRTGNQHELNGEARLHSGQSECCLVGEWPSLPATTLTVVCFSQHVFFEGFEVLEKSVFFITHVHKECAHFFLSFHHILTAVCNRQNRACFSISQMGRLSWG